LRPLSAVIGFYHWGGAYKESMSAGVSEIARLRARIARVTLSPRYLIDYGRSTSCQTGFSLSNALEDSDVRAALGNPDIEVMMITAYDGFSFGDCVRQRFLNPDFYTPENIRAVVREYSDFVVSLAEIFDGTKRFILSDWESDNAIYCGQAYTYATDEQFRHTCNEQYPYIYGGNSSPDDSLAGLVMWFQAIWAGISEGRARAAARHPSSIEVH
jgi:hypothetical protein